MALACLAALLLAADAVIPHRCTAVGVVGCYVAWQDSNSFNGPLSPSWYDVSGNGNHLAVTTANETGSVMADFDGAGYGVAFATPSDVQHDHYAANAGFVDSEQPALTTFTAFTFVAWVYIQDFISAGTGTFFSITGTDADASCANRVVFDTSGYREYHCGQYAFSALYSNNFQFQLNQWYMVTLVRDGLDVRMYSHGVGADSSQGLIGSGTSPLNLAYYLTDSTFFNLGRDDFLLGEANSFLFEGSMSFVGLWNAALNADDLLDIVSETGLQAVNYVSTPSTSDWWPTSTTDWWRTSTTDNSPTTTTTTDNTPTYATFQDYWLGGQLRVGARARNGGARRRADAAPQAACRGRRAGAAARAADVVRWLAVAPSAARSERGRCWRCRGDARRGAVTSQRGRKSVAIKRADAAESFNLIKSKPTQNKVIALGA